MTMKIEEQVLSREQMAHLVELGVDISDASMCWVAGEDTSTDEEEWYLTIPNNFLLPYNIPTYTIGDLIGKLPKYIDERHETYLSITNVESLGEWCVRYMTERGSKTDWFMSSNLLTALYDCLCWVSKNHKELIK